MSNLVAVVFPDQTTAFEMRAALLKMQKENLIDLEDSVVVTRDEKGKVKLDQATNLTLAGATGGGFWGMLIGLIFLNPLLGAAVGHDEPGTAKTQSEDCGWTGESRSSGGATAGAPFDEPRAVAPR